MQLQLAADGFNECFPARCPGRRTSHPRCHSTILYAEMKSYATDVVAVAHIRLSVCQNKVGYERGYAVQGCAVCIQACNVVGVLAPARQVRRRCCVRARACVRETGELVARPGFPGRRVPGELRRHSDSWNLIYR